MALLIVEDDRLISMFIGLELRAAGHAVRAAHSAAEALRALGSADLPEAALLDRSLPDGDSGAVAEALRARGVPFAWVTGHAADSFDALGAPVLAKPVAPARLKAATQALLAAA